MSIAIQIGKFYIYSFFNTLTFKLYIYYTAFIYKNNIKYLVTITGARLIQSYFHGDRKK